MPKKYSFLRHTLTLICAFSLVAVPAQAAKKKDEPQIEFTIELEDLPNYMSADQLRQWKEIERNLKFARADLETGEWLANKAYSSFVAKSKTDADRKKGQQMIKEATVRVETLTAKQNEFRVMAEKSKEQYQAQFLAQEIDLAIKSLSLTEAAEKPSEAMLYKLWNESYSKIFFGGAYVFSDGYYAKAEQLSVDMLATIARYDGNRYSLEEDTTEFSIDAKNGRPVITFEDREKMVGKFKSAILIAEIVYAPESPNGLYAIHAIDLKNGEMIDQIIVSFPINEASRESLGILDLAMTDDAADDPVEPEAESAAVAATDSQEAVAVAVADTQVPVADDTAPSQGLLLQLVDEKNFLGRLGEASNDYTFDISYIGQIDGFDQRAMIILNQALMRKQGLKVDDMEFVVKALPMANDDVELENIANATWRVSPTSPVDYGIGEYSVQAVAESNGREVKVDIGALIVTAADGSGIPPQAANR